MTTIYTYDINLPHADPILNERAFVKLPRSILLPPYLAQNPYYKEFCDAIDEIFDYPIEARLDALKNLRNMWVMTKGGEAKVAVQEMLNVTDWGGTDRATVIEQVNQLGMKLSQAGIVTEVAYRTIGRFLGQYWFEKGKATCMDFINFVLGTQFIIQPMWTTDYINFYSADDPIIGAKIYDSPAGLWYPTTHVSITMPGSYAIDPVTLTTFFYDIANYDLVLKIITNYYYCYFGTTTSNTFADVVDVGLDMRTYINMRTSAYVVNPDLTITEL